MKKIAVVLSLVVMFIRVEAYAFLPPSPLPPDTGRHIMNTGCHYSNTVRTQSHANTVNHVIISGKRPPVHIVPPPPPPRYSVRYKDDKKFHARSYYIPSYCMPVTGFYNNTFNPFCNHYRPYGSNIYISF